MAKKITNLTQGPRQFDLPGEKGVAFITFTEGGTSGATVEVSDEQWAALQKSPLQKAVLSDPNTFRVS
jgi:hypothetical protein